MRSFDGLRVGLLALALSFSSAHATYSGARNPCFGLVLKAPTARVADEATSPFVLNENEMKRRIAVIERVRQKIEPRMQLLSEALRLKGLPHDYGGRTKTYESLYDKVLRKLALSPRKRPVVNASDISDLMGFRFVVDNPEDVERVASEIQYALGENPKSALHYLRTEPPNKKNRGYRAKHLIAETKDGERFEIQVRTQAMNQWAEWDHAIYKRAVSTGDSVTLEEQRLRDYSKDVVDYIKAAEDGVKPLPPRPRGEKIPIRDRFPWYRLPKGWKR